MSNPILVSIITVCKNPGTSLHGTFSSVINQTYQNIQYIVIDAKSSDSTVEWLEDSNQKQFVSVLVSEPDEGIYSAINKGLGFAKGEIIGIIHAGDTYEQNAVAKIVSEYQKSNRSYGVIAGGMRLVAKNQHQSRLYLLDSNAHRRLDSHMSLYHPAVFVSDAAYKRNGVFDPSFRIAGDYDLLRRFYVAGERFLIVNKCLASMLDGGISTRFRSLPILVLETSKARFGPQISARKLFFSISLAIITLAHMVKSYGSRTLNTIRATWIG